MPKNKIIIKEMSTTHNEWIYQGFTEETSFILYVGVIGSIAYVAPGDRNLIKNGKFIRIL